MFSFSLQLFFSETLLMPKLRRDIIISTPWSCQILTKRELYQQILEKSVHIIFHEMSSMTTDRMTHKQTDGHDEA
jgi:hypothetical protein